MLVIYTRIMLFIFYVKILEKFQDR